MLAGAEREMYACNRYVIALFRDRISSHPIKTPLIHGDRGRKWHLTKARQYCSSQGPIANKIGSGGGGHAEWGFILERNVKRSVGKISYQMRHVIVCARDRGSV